jgi:hypothetical protein
LKPRFGVSWSPPSGAFRQRDGSSAALTVVIVI